MVIEPALAADKQRWLIVSNPRPTTTGGIWASIEGPEPVILDWDWCWTGEGWSSTADRAMHFAAREEAQRFIDENAESLTDSYERRHVTR